MKGEGNEFSQKGRHEEKRDAMIVWWMFDESSDEDLDKYEKIPVPKEKEKMKLKKNPPTYVFLKTNVKRCQGCYQIF